MTDTNRRGVYAVVIATGERVRVAFEEQDDSGGDWFAEVSGIRSFPSHALEFDSEVKP